MESAIEIKNLSVAYDGFDAVNDITAYIKKGEFIGITGPNGGGKTTLVSAVLGLIKPQNGEIRILNSHIRQARHSIGYVPQTADMDRNFPITVFEAVISSLLCCGLHPFRRFNQSEKKATMAILEKLGLDAFCNKPISALSGGEFQRLLIARALISNPEILILDEPISNIDAASKDKIYQILTELNNRGKTIIMVTHDLQNIDIFSRLIYINRAISFDGSPCDFLKSGGISNV